MINYEAVKITMILAFLIPSLGLLSVLILIHYIVKISLLKQMVNINELEYNLKNSKILNDMIISVGSRIDILDDDVHRINYRMLTLEEITIYNNYSEHHMLEAYGFDERKKILLIINKIYDNK